MQNYYVDIQQATTNSLPVSNEALEHWVIQTLKPHLACAELTLRFVSPSEMTTLNSTYRKINKVTNVLAFPASHQPNIELDYSFIGDIIICPDVLQEESVVQNIPLEAHWAHIVIHGVLHLLGYDHILEDDAAKMRPIEIQRLNELGYNNPYQTQENTIE